MTDTIFALSSGTPPAAIGVVRISGPLAGEACQALTGGLPEPRKAILREIRAPNGEILDRALVLWFRGPASATGEDCLELHCHGGRAVIASIENALSEMDGMRRAQPGEFTRRAFANGRIDLAEAEGLADLLTAETELQRRAAQSAADGAISQVVGEWRDRVLRLGAQLEATLDFSDEDDVDTLSGEFYRDTEGLLGEMKGWLSRPTAERLREGVRVVLAGPPNSGKSSLFNALLRDAAAITSEIAGTTRDAIERPVALGGVPLLLVDTAGLRDEGADTIETVGIELARGQMARADIVLWLGTAGQGPLGSVEVQSKIDQVASETKSTPHHRVSAVTGEGMEALERDIVARASALLPKPGDAALSSTQRAMVREASEAVAGIEPAQDLLVTAEQLRTARLAFDRLLGRASTEDMLDALFGRFCIGK